MTPRPAAQPSVLHDVDGNPVYIGLVPGFDGDAPFVVVTINGHESVIPARDAWRSGIAMVRLVAAVRDKPGAVIHGLCFSAGSSPEVTLPEQSSDEIGACLMGAAVSAVHDMAIWAHLSAKLGLDDDGMSELFADTKPLDIGALIFDQECERPPDVFGVQITYPSNQDN